MPITHKTPLTTIPNPGITTIRAAMLANALSVVDVEAGKPETFPILEALVGPPKGCWGLNKPYGKGGVSTCSMVALGLLRRLRVNNEAVMGQYIPGTGLNAARNYARKLSPSAWVTPKGHDRPKQGDVIDLRSPKGSADLSNHTEVVVGFEDDTIVCVAGGQVGIGGLQAIKLVRRKWAYVSANSPPTSGGRTVDGWIDISLLGYGDSILVPEGWKSLQPGACIA